jgi:steroid 5-alpha reductase family enzyme
MTFSHLKARPAIAPSLSIPMASAFVSWQRTGYSGWVDAIWTFAVGSSASAAPWPIASEAARPRQ